MSTGRTRACFHATRAVDEVLADGFVRPMRMAHVYAFSVAEAARTYAREFGYDAVVTILVKPSSVRSRWKPAYCFDGSVLKIDGPCQVAGRLA